MQLRCTASPIDELEVDTICVSLFDDERPLRGSTGLVDWRLCGAISHGILDGRFAGDLGENLLVHSGDRLAAARVLVSGTGPVSKYGYDRVAAVSARVAETLFGMKTRSVGLTLPGIALAGLDYAVAAGRVFDSFARYRSESEWLSQLEVNVVVHESRIAEVYCQLTGAAEGKNWVRMEGQKYKCVRS